MSSAAVLTQPNPETKSILIEANSLLFSDIPGYQTRLEMSFRMPFALDTRNTSFSATKNTSTLTGLEVRAHFSVPKISAPPMTPSPVPKYSAPKCHTRPTQLVCVFLLQLHAIA
jgi:hypothetical protein